MEGSIAPTKKRLTAEEARAQILEAAEKQLIRGGPDAVRVQVIARDLGLTDAAIHYHFKNREGLMKALLHQGGRKLKSDLAKGIAGDANALAGISDATVRLDDLYRRQGYAQLALWLSLSGWKSRGHGMFEPYCTKLHEARPTDTDPDDTKMAVALLNVALMGSALFGKAFLASVGLPADEKTHDRFRKWLAALLEERLGLPDKN